MIPKEKATDLLDKFYQATPNATTWNPVELNKEAARQAALICVDEMFSCAGFIWGGRDTETGLSARDSYRNYWRQVKEEIEKL